MEPIGPATAGHQSPGMFVDDHDFLAAIIALAHHVIHVDALQGVSGKGLVDGVNHRKHRGVE